MPFPPKGVLFDLDGTLLDTAPDLGHALNHVLAQHGFARMDYQDYRNHASHGAFGMLKCGFKTQLAEFDNEALRKQFLDYYLTNICIDTQLFEGIAQVITTLDDCTIPWGIVTNKPGWLTDALLPYFAELSSCQVVVSGDSLAERKPHPAPLLFAAEKIGIAPEHCWYLGDAERDIQAARAANMFAVIAAWGYISEDDEPENWQAHLSIKNASDLINYLKQTRN